MSTDLQPCPNSYDDIIVLKLRSALRLLYTGRSGTLGRESVNCRAI